MGRGPGYYVKQMERKVFRRMTGVRFTFTQILKDLDDLYEKAGDDEPHILPVIAQVRSDHNKLIRAYFGLGEMIFNQGSREFEEIGEQHGISKDELRKAVDEAMGKERG